MRRVAKCLPILFLFAAGCGTFESEKRSPPPVPDLSATQVAEATAEERFRQLCSDRGGTIEGGLCFTVPWFQGFGEGVSQSFQEREFPSVRPGTRIVAEGVANAEVFLNEMNLGRVPLDIVAGSEGTVRLLLGPGHFEDFNVWAEECIEGTSLEPVACP